MGKKKFINKKEAATYAVVFRSHEDPGVESAEASAHMYTQVGGRRDKEAADLSDYEDDYGDYEDDEASEEEYHGEGEGESEDWKRKRGEIIDMGLPDDGYDYTRHLRKIGVGYTSLEGAQGVFIPAPVQPEAPGKDVKAFDARNLIVMKKTEDEAEAAEMTGGVSVFARPAKVGGGGKKAQTDMQEVMEMLSDDDVETVDGGSDGEDDFLEDDFVLKATSAAAPEAAGGAGGGDAGAGPSGSSRVKLPYRKLGVQFDDDEDEDEGEWEDGEEGEEGGAGGGGAAKPPGFNDYRSRVSSVRPPKSEAASVLEERLDALELHYDDDELGSLDGDDITTQGVQELGDFEGVMDEFLEERRAGGDDYDVIHEEYRVKDVAGAKAKRGGGGKTLKEVLGAAGPAEPLRPAMAAAEAEPRADDGEDDGGRIKVEYEYVRETKAEDPADKWDCETIWSTASNLDNHPALLGAPPSERRRRKPRPEPVPEAEGEGEGEPRQIRLAANGMPVDYMPGGARDRREGAGGHELGEEWRDCTSRKGESKEEKKLRKQAVKQGRREARAQKKQLKTAFVDEAKKIAKYPAKQPTTLLL